MRTKRWKGVTLWALWVSLISLWSTSVSNAQTGIPVDGPTWYESRLKTLLSCQFEGWTIDEFATWLRVAIRGNVVIDWPALEDEGISKGTKFSLSLFDVTAESLLDTLLEQYNMTWTIRNRVLHITSQVGAGQELKHVIYPVSDLVGPSGHQDFDSLIELIEECIAPDSWASAGGDGAIVEFALGGSIVCSQTREVHRDIENLLAALRLARDRSGAGVGQPLTQATRTGGSSQAHVVAPASRGREPARQTRHAEWQVPRLHD